MGYGYRITGSGLDGMAEADIAYVAAAGAAGLALSVSAWAWRFRNRLSAREEALEREATTTAALLADRDGALGAFDYMRIALGPDGQALTLLGAPHAVMVARTALTHTGISDLGTSDAEALVQSVRALHGPSLDALAQTGEPCDLRIETAAGAWSVEGRSVGAAAWIRLAPLKASARVVDAGLGVLADTSPSPTWVTDATGELVWANRAWLAEVKATTLDEAKAANMSFDRGADQMVGEAGRLGIRQEGFRWTAGEGRRRAWKIVAEPLIGGGGAVLTFAIDMTEAEETRDTLRRHRTGAPEHAAGVQLRQLRPRSIGVVHGQRPHGGAALPRGTRHQLRAVAPAGAAGPGADPGRAGPTDGADRPGAGLCQRKRLHGHGAAFGGPAARALLRPPLIIGPAH